MSKEPKIKGIPPVWLFALITGFRNFLKRIFYKMVPPNVGVFEKAQGFWVAKAISVACELNLAEIVGKRTKSIDEIARQSGSDSSALYRLMRALASEGIFKEGKPGMFTNTAFSSALREGPGNMKHMIMHQLNETNWDVINKLSYSVRTGQAATQKLFGTDIFTHLEKNPEKNDLYNKAMSDTSRMASAAIVSAYPFKNIGSIVDLGGGQGYLLYNILKKHHEMTGILFDLPHVVENATEIAENYGVEKRVKIEPGNFLETVPAGADAYILKNILHAFADERCIALLSLIQKAIPSKGKVLIVEAVIGQDNRAAFGKIFDLQMLLGTENGKERTKEEYASLFNKSGFSIGKVVKTISPFSVIEGLKNE